MSLQIIQQILGIFLFFLSGILLSYIVFPKTDIIIRLIFSIVLAPCISIIAGIILYSLRIFTQTNTILVLILLSLMFLLRIFSFNKKYQTVFNKDIFYLLFFSLMGTFWRLRFLKSIKNINDPYAYAFKFIGNKTLDLGFYTGMAIDHSRFIGGYIFNKISEFLLINNLLSFFGIFLINFLFLGFIYLIFIEYRNRKLAIMSIALMSLGPIEIFYITFFFFGLPFSNLALFSIFLFYKSKEKNYFLIPLLLSTTMVFTYATSSVVNFLASIGFIMVFFLKSLIKNKKIKKSFKNISIKKVLIFFLIAIISISFVFGSYSFSSSNSNKESSSNLQLITKHITSYPLIEYKDPVFLGLSAIRWQMIFFFLCGLTFIFYFAKKILKKEIKEISEKELDLLFCLIPVLVVSFAFLYVNLPTRIFDYFAFFGLLVLKIPKKYLKIFFILSFIFLLITGFYVAENKKIFFETSDKEIEGALWVNSSLQGKIFSDQPFVNQLVLKRFYNVTGAYDDDILVYNLFYQNNISVFLNSINTLNKDLDVDYIVLTKRMQEKYILMVNVYQKNLININLYEENLEKIYDNEDVKVYKIGKETMK
jgi:hypothetical protein